MVKGRTSLDEMDDDQRPKESKESTVSISFLELS